MASDDVTLEDPSILDGTSFMDARLSAKPTMAIGDFSLGCVDRGSLADYDQM